MERNNRTSEEDFVERTMSRIESKSRITNPAKYRELLRCLYNNKQAWVRPGVRHAQISRNYEFSHQLEMLKTLGVLEVISYNYGSLLVDELNNRRYIGRKKINEAFEEYIENLRRALNENGNWNLVKDKLEEIFNIENREQLIQKLLEYELKDTKLFNFVVTRLLINGIDQKKYRLGTLNWKNSANYYWLS